MEKTTTDSKGRVVPTEEFQEHVHDLIAGVDKPWRNDGIVAHVYLESDLNTPEAAKLLEASTCVLASQTKIIRLRNEYRDIDTSTEYENPLDDIDLLQQLREEGWDAGERGRPPDV